MHTIMEFTVTCLKKEKTPMSTALIKTIIKTPLNTKTAKHCKGEAMPINSIC